MAKIQMPTVRNRIYNGEAGNLSLAEAKFTIPAGAVIDDEYEFLELLPGCSIKSVSLHQSVASGASVAGVVQLDDGTVLIPSSSLNSTTDITKSVFDVVSDDNNRVALVVKGANFVNTTTFTVRIQYIYVGAA